MENANVQCTSLSTDIIRLPIVSKENQINLYEHIKKLQYCVYQSAML